VNVKFCECAAIDNEGYVNTVQSFDGGNEDWNGDDDDDDDDDDSYLRPKE
jgi:hypothetical protein